MTDKNFPFNYMLTTNSIAVSYDNKHYMVTRSAEPARYANLRQAILDKDADAFIDALVPKIRVIRYSNEYFEIDDKNEMYMLDDLSTPIPKVIAVRLKEFADEKLPIEPLVYFWKKLRKNPSTNSKNMLYEFLEKNHHPITADGNFLAYKKVYRDGSGKLLDDYTKKIDNSVGKIVSMPRDQVVEDRNQTCSRGLHVAAWNYATTYSGNVMVEVIVDPTDVVSVPRDYDQQKMRVCRYKVASIITEGGKAHADNLKTDRNESGMKHKTDVKSAVNGKNVSFVALTAKEIIDVVVKLVGKSSAEPVSSMSLKNKQPIVKKAKTILEAAGYTVTTEAPKSR